MMRDFRPIDVKQMLSSGAKRGDVVTWYQALTKKISNKRKNGKSLVTNNSYEKRIVNGEIYQSIMKFSEAISSENIAKD